METHAPPHLQLLQFNVRTLEILSLWPDPKTDKKKTHLLKNYAYLIFILPSSIPILCDLIMQMMGDMDDIIGITENLIALADIAGMNFMCVCFLEKRDAMRHLVARLQSFRRYGDRAFTAVTERRVVWITKVFLVYCFLGNAAYFCTPLLQLGSCQQNVRKLLQSNRTANGIHCGIITRCRYPFDTTFNSLNFWMVCAHQCSVCLLVTVTVLMITMFMCAMLMHTVEELKQFKAVVSTVLDGKGADIHRRLKPCIRYHIDIIEFAKTVDDAFNKMMVVHMTLTSGVISILLFEVLMVNTPGDTLRFGMHLCGWLVLLLLTCYFGQSLIDESTSVAQCLYATNWFETAPAVRRDILFMIARSQISLKLTATSLGTISLETFLKVLSTAYSYFTLLLNIKQ